jgi:hypothetical protein
MPATQRPEPKHLDQRMESAHSLADAANSGDSLEGYVAVNHGAGPHGDRAIEHDRIAELAYQFYRERNGMHGSSEEDWLRAERELRQRNKGTGDERPTIPGDAMNL